MKAVPRIVRRRWLACIAVLLLSACAADPLHFHTLLADTQPAPAREAGFAIDVQRVRVPAQVDHPELVLRASDGQLVRIENRRWSAPLPDEVRGALAAALSSQLGAADVSSVAAIPERPLYRVVLDVQRFDAREAQGVALTAVWSLRLIDGGKERQIWTCASRVERPAAAGYEALVGAAQDAVAGVATDIAALIDAAQRDARHAACRR